MYNAEQMSALFDGIITDGVFSSIGNVLVVSAMTGMNVSVGSGRAWFKHTWTNNDAAISLTVDASEIVLNRIDTVVLEINSDVAVRANSIKIIKGTPASSPVAPTLTVSELINQYPLGNIYVAAGVTSIISANITITVGTTACPFAKGIFDSSIFTGGASTIVTDDLSASRALVSNESGKVAASPVTATELGRVSGVTSPIQTQMDGKSPTSHDHSGVYAPDSHTSLASTTSAAGHIEIATSAEVTTGTDSSRAVVPSTLKIELDKKANTTHTTPASSETAAGHIEIATSVEVTTGTDASRAVVPSTLKIELDKKANTSHTTPASSETAAGHVELATAAEVTTGTDTLRAVTPAGLKVELDKKVNLLGGTFTGPAIAQNNTSYTTKQIRNITLSTADPSGGGNGDIWFKYTP